MAKELIIPHAELEDPQRVTQRNIEEFKKHDLNIHVNEVEDIDDDHQKGVRRIRVRNTKFFDMGRRGR